MSIFRPAIFTAAVLIALVCGCTKRAPTAPGTLTRAALARELVPVPVSMDDNSYAVLAHEWVVAELEKHVARTWHDRPYVAEAKDCDDFTDYLISATLRHDYGEQAAAGSGAIPVARYTVAMPAGTHRVALLRTASGWYVVDPQVQAAQPPHEIPLIPLSRYPHRGLKAEF